MKPKTGGDDGFVMIDVMTAAAVLAIAGAAAIGSMVVWVQQQQRMIDRSVEMVNFFSFVETLALDRRYEKDRSWDDGTFKYQIMSIDSHGEAKGLVELTIRSFDYEGKHWNERSLWLPK